MVPLAVGDFVLVNHESNKTDKRKRERERETEARRREIFRFS